jgi:PKHD-type hydroxylase|tara:strand:+ start:110 stop:700 length:591 start_codon:yes stop_codon:yes gene_type:complete
VTANSKLSFGEKLFYTIDPELPPLILSELTKQVKKLPFHRSRTGAKGVEIESSIRTSQTSWLCWDTWIAGIMHNMFISANNDYFKFDLDHFDSGIQVTKYETGQYYEWHVDAADSRDPCEDLDAPPRKLSMSMVLDTEFEGGNLEIFSPPDHQIQTYSIPPGTVAIFPSWVSHRVTPVTSGTRYSLVAWMNGPEFK